MNSLKDKYFRYPLIIDSLLGVTLNSLLYFVIHRKLISYPQSAVLLQVSTDISTVSLTLAGFVLTFLTVLITYKMGTTGGDNQQVASKLIDIFFNSTLYFRSVKILQGCIGALIFTSILGFLLKLFLTESKFYYLMYANVLGIAIIITTLSRSLFILTRIMNFQKEQTDHDGEYR